MSKAAGPSLGEVVSVASFVMAIITAWLYAIGWTYAYWYFDAFHVPLLMVDLPLQHYFVYGGLVLWKGPLTSLGLAIGIGAIAAACAWFAGRLGRFGLSAIVLAVIVALFLIGRWAAIATAGTEYRFQYQSDYPAYPRVALALKKEAGEAIGDQLGDIARTDCGRLVLYSAGRLFLIRPVRDNRAAKLPTVVIPTDQVQALRVLDEYQSCM